jgi:hypothetical protein
MGLYPRPEARGIGLRCHPEGHSRTEMPGSWARALPTEASQDQNAGNPGLGEGGEDLPHL